MQINTKTIKARSSKVNAKKNGREAREFGVMVWQVQEKSNLENVTRD